MVGWPSLRRGVLPRSFPIGGCNTWPGSSYIPLPEASGTGIASSSRRNSAQTASTGNISLSPLRGCCAVVFDGVGLLLRRRRRRREGRRSGGGHGGGGESRRWWPAPRYRFLRRGYVGPSPSYRSPLPVMAVARGDRPQSLRALLSTHGGHGRVKNTARLGETLWWRPFVLRPGDIPSHPS